VRAGRRSRAPRAPSSRQTCQRDRGAQRRANRGPPGPGGARRLAERRGGSNRPGEARPPGRAHVVRRGVSLPASLRSARESHPIDVPEVQNSTQYGNLNTAHGETSLPKLFTPETDRTALGSEDQMSTQTAQPGGAAPARRGRRDCDGSRWSSGATPRLGAGRARRRPSTAERSGGGVGTAKAEAPLGKRPRYSPAGPARRLRRFCGRIWLGGGPGTLPSTAAGEVRAPPERRETLGMTEGG
jgi:hypothetical protein